MTEVRRSADFVEWLDALRDRRAATKIIVRVQRLSEGNRGSTRTVGDGVSEMKIDFGPGYRVYFLERGTGLVVLLCGGDKSS